MRFISKSFIFLPFFAVSVVLASDYTKQVLQEQHHRETQRGTCGGGNRGNGICSNGQCCSSYGWCGTSAAHCSGTTGTTSSGGGTCGGGNRGNGICANGQCCSTYGWCGTSPAHCSGNGGSGSGGGGGTTVTTSPGGGGGGGSSSGCAAGWKPASWTTYTSYAPCCVNSPNYNPNADTTECVLYSACDYTGDFSYIGHKSFTWVKSNNIVAFYSTTNNESFGNKRIRIAARGKTIEALVADTCADSDCNNCCSKNAKPSGYLVDMEYWTVVKNFGDIAAATGQICWQLV